MRNITQKIEHIKNKEDFLEFVVLLIQDFKNNPWDNHTLEQYLFGMEGFVDDIDGYFINKNDLISLEKIKNNELDWKILAQIMVAATMYE